MKVWRWTLAVGFGATVALTLFALGYLFVQFATDFAPRLMLRTAPVALPACAVVSGLIALGATFFVHRAMNGPALARRIGGGLATLGVVVVVGGVSLFFVPPKPPVHPGETPAGDIAAGAISLVVVYAGFGLLIVGTLVGLIGLIAAAFSSGAASPTKAPSRSQ